MKEINIALEMEDDEYIEFLKRDDVQGNLEDWFYSLISQNYNCGMLTFFKVIDKDE